MGVVGNIENLGLEKLGVKTERGLVDRFSKTSVAGIYAIEMSRAAHCVAHKAGTRGCRLYRGDQGAQPSPDEQGYDFRSLIVRRKSPRSSLTEQAAKDKKLDIRVGRFPLTTGKAIALGEDQGLVKVIFDKKTGQLLGAHMVGAEVTELIQGYVVAMNLETTEEELMHMLIPMSDLVRDDEGSGPRCLRDVY